VKDSPDIRAVCLAAAWAQRLGLPPGNLWEPGIVRGMLQQWRDLGGDASAWALTQALFERQLGMV
jgi:hypothetical protein